MAGGLVASAVIPHTPRMGIEENAPEFVRGMIGGIREAGDALRALGVELIVLQSAHWVSTFNWYVSAQPVHEGICVADEAPDMIPGIPYKYTGDAEYAVQLAEAVQAAGIPCGLNESPHYNWDYGTWVPLKYLDPDAAIRVVTLPTVVCSELDESLTVGRLAHEVAGRMGRRAAFISSCALSHKVLRGPELWPSEELQAMDRRLIDLLTAGNVAELTAWMPEFSAAAVAEMGGRTLCGMVGAAAALGQSAGPLEGRQYGPYGQSSGSGNASVLLAPKNV